MDVKKKGFLLFEDFSRIQSSEKQQLLNDPYLQKAITTHVQDSLALERKQERERIAKELIESVT